MFILRPIIAVAIKGFEICWKMMIIFEPRKHCNAKETTLHWGLAFQTDKNSTPDGSALPLHDRNLIL